MRRVWVVGHLDMRFPSGAKAQDVFELFMYGLKPVPFKLKPVLFKLKPVPFKLKPVLFLLKPVLFRRTN